jgi:hypothetical protein
MGAKKPQAAGQREQQAAAGRPQPRTRFERVIPGRYELGRDQPIPATLTVSTMLTARIYWKR